MANTSKKRSKGPSPWITKSDELRKLQRVAESINGYRDKSKEVLKNFQTREYLPILHIRPEEHPDHLLRLHMLLRAVMPQKMFIRGCYGEEVVSAGALIIVDSANGDGEGFKQACWVAHEQSKVNEVAIFKDGGYLFENVVVIRGVTGKLSPSNAISRIDLAVRNLIKKVQYTGVVWHECTSIGLLGHMVSSVSQWHSSFGNSPLKAVSISTGLSIDDDALERLPGLPSPAITESFLKTMRDMRIPIVFVNEHILNIYSDPSYDRSSKAKWHSYSTLLPGFSYTWPFLLPPAAIEPILKENMDDLAVSIYRLQAKYSSIHSNTVTMNIKKEFSASKSKFWANRIIKDEEFEEEKCKKPEIAELLLEIYPNASAPAAFTLANLPGALLDPACNFDALMALRVEIDFSVPKLRARIDDHSPTYILISQDPQIVINTLHTQWLRVQQHMIPQGKMAVIDKGLANTWLYLAGVLSKRLEYMYKGKAFRTWDKKDREVFQVIWWVVMNGGMSYISTASLGMTPKKYWK